MNGRFECEFVPDWDTIQSAWDPCMDHLNRMGVDPDASYALCMVVLELLENAVKYGAYEEEDKLIRLTMNVRNNQVTTIEVRTPLDAEDSTHLNRLDRMIQWIRGYQNPFEAYVERLKQVAVTPHEDQDSGLGLVRIAYEGQCILDFFVDDKNELAMSAVYQPRKPTRVTPPKGTHAATAAATSESAEEQGIFNAK